MDNTVTWYQTLTKPPWAPPSWLFGPVWSVLYIMIAISFGYVLFLALRQKLSWFIALPFILNLIFNIAFSPIQFGLRSNILASVDILLVFGTLVWLMVAIFPIIPWVAIIQIPYLLWVSFATILQLTITYLNISR